MMTPNYFANNDSSDDSDEDFNFQTREVWQINPTKPLMQNQNQSGAKDAQFRRQNSYLSATTATSATTTTASGASQYDLGGFSLHSDGGTLEAEAANNLKFTETLESHPETPATADESFFSSDDDTPVDDSKNTSLDRRLNATLEEEKPELYQDESDAESLYSLEDIGLADTTVPMGSDVALGSRVASYVDTSVVENNTEAGSDFTTLSSNGSSNGDSSTSESERVSSTSISDRDSARPTTRSSRSSGSRTSPRKEGKRRSHRSPRRDGDKSPSRRSHKSWSGDSKSPSRRSSGHGSQKSKRSATSCASHRSPTRERKSPSRRSHRSPRRDEDKSPSRRSHKSLRTDEKSTPRRSHRSPKGASKSPSRNCRSREPPSIQDTEQVPSTSIDLFRGETTAFEAAGSSKRTILVDSEPETLSVPISNLSQDKVTKPTSAEPRDYDFFPIDLIDEDDDELATRTISPLSLVSRAVSPLSPTNEPNNVRQLEYVDFPLRSSLKNGYSKSPSQTIYSIPHIQGGDEETGSESMKLIGSKGSGESSTACESSEFADDSINDMGSNVSSGRNNRAQQTVAADQKKPVETEARTSRCRYIKMMLVACALLVGLAAAVPFVISATASAAEMIETPSPSVSMAPSSTPSLSQAPSDAPSSNPSIYPTISDAPSIAPSGNPTISLSPSMAPSLSDAPTPSPSAVPTESMVPSLYPSSAPSDSPSSNPSSNPSSSPSAAPTQTPTRTFRPSSSPSVSPTRAPSVSPTDYPTLTPIAPPPLDAFKIRLYWSPDYFWQESTAEAFWCMECVYCAEYGGTDAMYHGCISHGTGDERMCQAGDTIWIRDCRNRGNRFYVEQSNGREFMLRVANTNLCIERIKTDHPHLYLQGCEPDNEYQRFKPWNDYRKFELRPPGLNDCVTNSHHPKSEELVSLHNCRLAGNDETLYWERY